MFVPLVPKTRNLYIAQIEVYSMKCGVCGIELKPEDCLFAYRKKDEGGVERFFCCSICAEKMGKK